MTKPVPYFLTPTQYAVARRVIKQLDSAAYVYRSQAEQEAVRQINAHLVAAGETAAYTVSHLRGALGRRKRRKPAARSCSHQTAGPAAIRLMVLQPSDNVGSYAPYDVLLPQDFDLLPAIDSELLAEAQALADGASLG